MPHNNHNAHSGHTGSSGDDLGSTDEVKIFKDEGDREDEKISSENLLEEKSSLIDLTESEEKSGKSASRPDHSPVFGKVEPHASSFNMGYLVSPYSYTNGAAGGLPVSMANKMGLSPFFCHNGDPLTTPPPAHCGIPPYQLDPKAMGLTRPAIYPFPTSQYPYPMLSPDMSQVAASWHTPSVYSAASSFRSPYPSSLPINTTLSSDFSFRFSPSLLPSVHTPPHHVLNSHPAIVTPGPKQEIGQESNHRYSRSLDQKNSPSVQADCKDNSNEKKKPHIKKPLNAFMLYMKEMRAKVVAECTLKESAAINQILGRRWHELTREEQSKYYEKARQERQLHMELYPGWSARDNYGYVSKKKKRKKDRSPADSGGNNMKKCRARFGLDQQNQWCKPCRRKKKCIRYMEVEGEENNGDIDNHVSDDNLGSCGSVDDAKTPEDDTESLNQSLSSPGCLSGLSSLQSPSTSLASPLNLLTSPSTPSTMHNSHEQQQQTHQQSIFADGTQQQQQQQISNNNVNNSHPLNNLDKHKKCIGNNNISNNSSITNSTDIMNSNSNSTTLNKHHTLTSSLPPSMISSSASTIISNVPSSSSNVSSSSTVSSSAESPGDIQIKSEKIISNSSISPLLGVHLAAMGIGPNDRISPHISGSPGSTIPSSSTASLLSLPNHLFMDSMNKISNTKSQSGLTGSIGEISAGDIKQGLSMQSNIDDKSSGPLKLLTHRQQQQHLHHHQQHQNSILNQLSSTTSNSNSVQSSTSSISLPNSPFGADMFLEKTIRNPVGANPRDVNNPLSINQLTKRDYTINTPTSSPTNSQQQSLSTLPPPQSSSSHHQHIPQHHMHNMLTTSSNAPLTLSSPSISSSSSSSLSCTTSSNDLTSKSSQLQPLTSSTTHKTVESNSSPFNIRTIGNDNVTTSIQQQLQQSSMQQQHKQQQPHHQGLYQPVSTSSSISSSSSSSPSSSSHHHNNNHHTQQQQQQQHYHNLSTALGQHLPLHHHHFSPHHHHHHHPHFPAVGAGNSTANQNGNNLTGGISTKSSPAVPTIGGQSNSTHHRSSDGDSGAISVT